MSANVMFYAEQMNNHSNIHHCQFLLFYLDCIAAEYILSVIQQLLKDEILCCNRPNVFAVGPSVSVVLVHTLAIFSCLRLFIAYKYPKAQITGRNIVDKPMTYIKVLKGKQIRGQNCLLSVSYRSFCLTYPVFSGWQFRVFSSPLNEDVGVLAWR